VSDEPQSMKRKQGQRGPDKAPRKRKGEQKTDAPASRSEGAPAPSWKDGALQTGAEHLISLLWFVSQAGSFVVGGKLTALTEQELKAGAKEAVPLIRRLAWLASFLTYAGLPIWLIRTLPSHFSVRPKQAKKPAAPAAPAAESAQPAQPDPSQPPSNVVPMNRG
jgi:hypothetical protein